LYLYRRFFHLYGCGFSTGFFRFRGRFGLYLRLDLYRRFFHLYGCGFSTGFFGFRGRFGRCRLLGLGWRRRRRFLHFFDFLDILYWCFFNLSFGNLRNPKIATDQKGMLASRAGNFPGLSLFRKKIIPDFRGKSALGAGYEHPSLPGVYYIYRSGDMIRQHTAC
jgi:hypothetical protein